MILALDLSSRLNGFCAGSGLITPVADAFKLAQHNDDLGAMLAEFDDNLCALIKRFSPDLLVYESPILPSAGGSAVMGSLLTRRKLFALGAFVEYVCHRIGIPCAEEHVRTIKKELSGSGKASKETMVACALKCGISLPETLAAGREDAADAFGLFLLALRHTDKTLSAQWDRKLHGARGLLI